MKVLTITAYETVVYEKEFEISEAVYQEAVKRLNHTLGEGNWDSEDILQELHLMTPESDLNDICVDDNIAKITDGNYYLDLREEEE